MCRHHRRINDFEGLTGLARLVLSRLSRCDRGYPAFRKANTISLHLLSYIKISNRLHFVSL